VVSATTTLPAFAAFWKIGRLADGGRLLGLSRGRLRADHHEPRGHADAQLRSGAACRSQRRRRGHQREPGANGVFGIVLGRLGIAEIRNDPIALVAGKIATVPTQDLRAISVAVGRHHAEIFRIKPRG